MRRLYLWVLTAIALTNVVSNGVATLVIARWQGGLDRDRLYEVLTHRRRGATTGLPSSAVSTLTDAA